MLALGSLAFASPWLLAALAALPVIWWLLRVTPPAPRRIVFPAIRLLLGLTPREETPARTPWWLILLRSLLAALVLLALAHPLLNPQNHLAGTGPIALIVDNGWAAARDWSRRQTAAIDILAEAEREDRQIILVTTAPLASDEAPPPLQPVRAVDARAAVQALQPKPWPSDRTAALKRLEAMPLPQGGAALWIGDGIDEGGAAPLAAYLARQGDLRYLAAAEGDMPRLLAASGSASEMAGRDVSVVVRSLPASGPQALTVRASAEDGALLAREPATIAPDEANVAVRLPLPTELRNRVTRIEIEGEDSAGAVLLVDERWRRRPVGIAAAPNTAGQPLLSENYYLERALGPFTEVRRGRAADLLKREIAVLVYADAGPDSPAEEEGIKKWVEAGGLLLRFAGPRLAEQSDHLLPVRLRRGGRTLGGALSWEKPARLAPFAAESPFAGLAIPADVTVSRQVLAEPDIDLASKTWARLADGTPLVTAEKRGEGWVVLVHTTANAEWSNLALSGLFVEMLRRTVAMSQGVTAAGEGALPPLDTLDGFGRLQHAPPAARADDAFVLKATSELRLAYVRTGSDTVDAQSRAGMLGLTDTLNRRTAVETAEPLAVDLERDELIFFPLLYWPVTAEQTVPSPRAAERINRYLETGGTILFDTRDAGEETPGPFGSAATSQSRLRRLAAGIKIPQLVPVPPDHVLTKSFYLLHEFPGRWNTGQVWVEQVEDRVNDGVASVIVGSNDWAGAWAIDAQGRPAYPVVPGGEPQREMAMRFGINLVMFVLTGNYKTDQVHVPAILERLGQ